MTCIVGFTQDGFTYMGADSCGGNGYTARPYANSKLFKRNGIVIGFTSSYRMGQLLEHADGFPEGLPDNPDEHFPWMVNTLIPAVRTILSEGGLAKKENEVESGGEFLVGTPGELFKVQSDYSVLTPLDGMGAVGSGDEVALGALHATRNLSLTATDRVRLALEAAAAINPNVLGPWHFWSLGADPRQEQVSG